MADKKDKKKQKKDKKTKPKVTMKQTTKQTVTINLAKSPAKRRRSPTKAAAKETTGRPTPGPIYITNPPPTIVPNPPDYTRFAEMLPSVDYKRIESFIPKPEDYPRIEAPVDYPRIGDMIREVANTYVIPPKQVEYVPITESIPISESTKTSRLTLRKPPVRKQLTEEQKERKRIYDRNRRQMQKQLRAGTWEDAASIVEEEM